VSFAASCHQQAAAARSAAGAVPDAAAALTHFAHTLDDAQRDARQAIADARDAQHRIDQAEADIADAQAAQQVAATQADAANHRIAMSSIGGVPSVDAQADLQAASDAGQAAADRETAARRRLDAARDDLERAERRGHHAMDRARDGSQAVSGALGSGPAMPPIGMPGAPAAAAWRYALSGARRSISVSSRSRHQRGPYQSGSQKSMTNETTATGKAT